MDKIDKITKRLNERARTKHAQDITALKNAVYCSVIFQKANKNAYANIGGRDVNIERALNNLIEVAKIATEDVYQEEEVARLLNKIDELTDLEL
jgi:hypothetical protein